MYKHTMMGDTIVNDLCSNSIDEAHSSKVEDHAPLPTGTSSPRSPLEFDKHDGNRGGWIQKSVSFAVPAPESLPVAADNHLATVGSSLPVVTSETAPSRSSGKKVSFAQSVTVREVQHINDFSKEEIEELWMTATDYEWIKSMVKMTVMRMMNGLVISDDDPVFCTRGLEYRTKAGAKIRSRNKLRARSAVLNEQDMQREEGFDDPRFIAMVSMDESVKCREAALSRGAHDEASIQSYLSDVKMWSTQLQ